MSFPFVMRQANEKDIPLVLALQRSVPEAPHWNEAIYQGFLAVPTEAIQQRLLVVAAEGEHFYGYAAATVLALDGELESIAVATEARRSGVGSTLLNAVLDWCAAAGADVLRLEVRAANLSAQAFYRSAGFQQKGLRRGYYRHPDDDGVLMLRWIGKSG